MQSSRSGRVPKVDDLDSPCPGQESSVSTLTVSVFQKAKPSGISSWIDCSFAFSQRVQQLDVNQFSIISISPLPMPCMLYRNFSGLMCESPDTKRLKFYDADDVSLNTLLAAMAPSDRRCPHVSALKQHAILVSSVKPDGNVLVLRSSYLCISVYCSHSFLRTCCKDLPLYFNSGNGLNAFPPLLSQHTFPCSNSLSRSDERLVLYQCRIR